MKRTNHIPWRFAVAAVLLAAVLCPALAAQLPPVMVVVKPVANMYSAPTEDTDVVSQAIYASNVAVLEQQEGWYKIRTSDDYTGWVPSSALLRPKADVPYGAPAGGLKPSLLTVTSLYANIYREDSVTKHAPLLTVPYGTMLESAVTVQRFPGGARWHDVRLPDGRHGFIQSGDVSAPPKPLSIEQTIAEARRFLGIPYFWGGTSSFGFDCSGFMQMLVGLRGHTMPRDAGPQAAWDKLTKIEKDQLQPGDLLYFGASVDKITHTGMYIGAGQFIHATTHEHPVVQIGRLQEPYWTRLLVACRRLK